MSSLHDHVLNRIVGFFFRRNLENNWVDFFPLGDLFLQEFFADFLSDQNNRYAAISEETIEVILYSSFVHF